MIPAHEHYGDQFKAAIYDELAARLEDLLTWADAPAPELRVALELTTATVELHTGNGAQSQPAWPLDANGNIDYDAVAATGRAAIRLLAARVPEIEAARALLARLPKLTT